MSTIRGRPIALLLLALQLAGCSSWQPSVAGPPRFAIQYEAPDQVRVTRLNGDRLVIRNPTMRGGSINGTAEGEAVNVPTSDVRQLEVRRFSGGRTVGLVLVVIPVFALGVAPLVFFRGT